MENVRRHLHRNSTESGQRPVETRVLQKASKVGDVPGVSASMIRMFMWPLQCLKGSGTELTLACSKLDRHLCWAAAHWEHRRLARDLASFKQPATTKQKKNKKRKPRTRLDPGTVVTLASPATMSSHLSRSSRPEMPPPQPRRCSVDSTLSDCCAS